MEQPVHYLVLLILQFDGTMIKEVLEFTRDMTLLECGDFAHDHYEAIATHLWDVDGDAGKSGYYLNDGRGTIQGHICIQDINKVNPFELNNYTYP